ncbi:MAG TPA: glycosyltransferase [Agriterribacter sp.]|nr:glycosyltransferase [Agriterribacter sp.]
MQEKKFVLVRAKPLISIITLNWNQADITCQFLESTRNLIFKNYEILVCDMGSAIDPSSRIIAGKYPNTRIIKNDIHSSFNINCVIKEAQGDFILLINNHTEVTENILDELLAPFLKDPGLGITCPKIRSFHKKNIIQYAGYKPVNMMTGRTTVIGNKMEDRGQFDKPAYIQGAYSGAMMFKKSVIEKTGMLPDNFFIYFDDFDISSRITKKGYRILYQPKAVIYDKQPLFSSQKSALNVYYTTRNRILFMRRNTRPLQFSIFLFLFIFISMPINIVKFSMARQFLHLQSFFKAIVWNIKVKEVA